MNDKFGIIAISLMGVMGLLLFLIPTGLLVIQKSNPNYKKQIRSRRLQGLFLLIMSIICIVMIMKYSL